jgi:hypothetical protein
LVLEILKFFNYVIVTCPPRYGGWVERRRMAQGLVRVG